MLVLALHSEAGNYDRILPLLSLPIERCLWGVPNVDRGIAESLQPYAIFARNNRIALNVCDVSQIAPERFYQATWVVLLDEDVSVMPFWASKAITWRDLAPSAALMSASVKHAENTHLLKPMCAILGSEAVDMDALTQACEARPDMRFLYVTRHSSSPGDLPEKVITRSNLSEEEWWSALRRCTHIFGEGDAVQFVSHALLLIPLNDQGEISLQALETERNAIISKNESSLRLIPREGKSNSVLPQTHAIPHVVHRVWISANPFMNHVPLRYEQRKRVKGFEERVWTNDSLLELMHNNWPAYIQAYHEWPLTKQNEFARCLVVATQGGVYANFEAELSNLPSMLKLCKQDSLMLFERVDNTPRIDILGAKPNHAFFASLLSKGPEAFEGLQQHYVSQRLKPALHSSEHVKFVEEPKAASNVDLVEPLNLSAEMPSSVVVSSESSDAWVLWLVLAIVGVALIGVIVWASLRTSRQDAGKTRSEVK